MLMLNHSHLNKEYNLINVLKALVATISMCSLLVIFLSKITPRCKIEVFTAVTMKNGIFWDVTLCGSCKNQRFGGT
jgi:hypothetical protein